MPEHPEGMRSKVFWFFLFTKRTARARLERGSSSTARQALKGIAVILRQQN